MWTPSLIDSCRVGRFKKGWRLDALAFRNEDLRRVWQRGPLDDLALEHIRVGSRLGGLLSDELPPVAPRAAKHGVEAVDVGELVGVGAGRVTPSDRN